MTQDPRLTALVYAPSGWGKTWLGATTPPPRLIIDLEGRAPYSPAGRKAVLWDGMSNPMELGRSESRTYIVTVTEPGLLDHIKQWLRVGPHPFKSVTVDSLMFAQMRERVAISSGPKFDQQNWGELLWKIERLVQELHDLTLLPPWAPRVPGETQVRCVVFLAGSTTRDGYQVPMMQGAIGAKLPYLVDVAGYLDNARDAGGELVRQLIVEPYPLQGIRDVKDGTDIIRSKFGGVIANPDFTAMYEALRAQEEG